MKLTKGLVAVLCAVAVLGSGLIAGAHSGGTDASGGHWNHKTGQYHYHHGYPAHQHPGGVCPYAYNAGSHSSSGSSSSSSSSSGSSGTYSGGSSAKRSYDNGSRTPDQVKELQRHYGVTPDGKWGAASKAAAGGLTADEAWNEVFPPVTHIQPKEYSTEPQADELDTAEKPPDEFTKEGKIVICLLAVLLFWWPVSVFVKDVVEDYRNRKQKRESVGLPDIVRPAQLPAKYLPVESQDQKLAAVYRERFEGKSTWETAGVPGWAYFDRQDKPHTMICEGEEDPFIVYVTASGKRYHKERCRMAFGGRAVNLCDALAMGKTPCAACDPMRELPDFVLRYQFLKKIQREYGIDMLP